MSCLYCWSRERREGYSTVNDTPQYKCRWGCCVLSTCACLVLFIGLFLIILFAAITPKIPSMVQTQVDASRLIITKAHMTNPTNESIELHTTMSLVNGGSNTATIDGTKVNIIDQINGIKIGEMNIPTMHVKANKELQLNQTNILTVTNHSAFQSSIKRLLNGSSVTWEMHGSTNIHTTLPILNSKYTQSIKLTKTLVLPAGKIMNPTASNFEITQVTTSSITGSSSITMTKTGIMTMSLFNVSFYLYDAENPNIMLGYANVSKMEIQEGINQFSNGKTTILKNGKNDASISKFLSRYLAGNDSKIIMIGPYFHNHKTVIDGALVQIVTNKGSTKPPSGVGGFETQTSMNGWPNSNDPSKPPIRGGYSNLRNDLNVSLLITKLSVHLYLHKPFGYTVDMGFGVPPNGPYASCNVSSELSHMYLGPGIDKNNFNKTWIEIPPNSKKSFFVIGEPITKKSWEPPTINWFCNLQLGYDCCFSTVVIASACVNNLKVNGSNDVVLEQDFIATRLYSNMTVAINGSFVVDLKYYQSFFPVFPSSEIYNGFKIHASGGVIPTPNCGKVSNYTFG